MDEQVLNKTFNELTIKKLINKPTAKDYKYKSWNTNNWVHCECSCGKEVDYPLKGVVSGQIKSCGHLKAEKAAATLAEIKKKNPTPTARYLTHEGKTMNISEWSKETGIPRTTIMHRLDKKMPIDKVLERKKVYEKNQKEN